MDSILETQFSSEVKMCIGSPIEKRKKISTLDAHDLQVLSTQLKTMSLCSDKKKTTA